jgi:mannose/fructose-specific phosphotransferase system component IIA
MMNLFGKKLKSSEKKQKNTLKRRSVPFEGFKEHDPLEMDINFRQIGFYDDYSYDMANDIANAYSHIMNGGRASDSFLEIEGVDDEALYHRNVQKFIEGINFDDYTGDTPLQKASSIITMLSNVENTACENEGGMMETFKSKMTEKEKEELKKKLEEAQKQLEQEKKEQEENGDGQEDSQDGDGDSDEGEGDGKDGEGKDPADGEDSKNQKEGNSPKGKPKPGQTGTSPEVSKTDIDYLKKLNLKLSERTKVVRKAAEVAPFIYTQHNIPEVLSAKLSYEQEKLLEKLAILESRGKIKSKKKALDLKAKQMTEYSQISRLMNVSSIMMPTFDFKFATKQLVTKQAEQASKQLLVLLIDYSGSMSEREKISWVNAIVYNRLKAVMDNKAELLIGFFVESLDMSNMFYLKNKKDAMAFGKTFRFSPYGGNTNIQCAIEQVCDGIDKGKIGPYSVLNVNPQIVVMNDGQDMIDRRYKPKYVTNAFILGQDNHDLKSVIENSKGHYERFL